MTNHGTTWCCNIQGVNFTTEEAAGYIAAIIDGEGWVAEQRATRKRALYRVTIANTDLAIVQAVRDALDVLGVRHYVNSYDRPGNQQRMHHVLITHRDGLRALHKSVRLRCPRKQHALDAQIALYDGTGRG